MKTKGEIKLAVVAFLIFACWAFVVGLTAAIDAPTFHLDGAFQNASGLFRLSAGQWPGKDFFPYLGIGPLFIQYPIFYSFGSDLAASVISATFTTLTCGLFVFSIIIHLVFRPSKFGLSVFIGCIAFLFFSYLANLINSPFLQWLNFLENPGNSLRPVRSFAPYLVALIYYLFILNIKRRIVYLISASFLLGLMTTWSNDFAIPTILIFSFFFYLVLLKKSKKYIGDGILLFLFSLIFAALALTVSTFGHVIPLLKFNFLDVAGDQWWYFAPYTERFRILDWKDLFKLINQENYRALIVFTALLIYRLFDKAVENTILILIGLVLFTGGALASIGGHLGGYFQGFDCWAIIVMFSFAIKAVCVAIKIFFKNRNRQLIKWILTASSVAAVCFSAFFMSSTYNAYNLLLHKAGHDESRFYVNELGAYLRIEWKDYIQFARKNSSWPVIEEYWGIWSAVNKVFPPWPVDSVIHALGDVRIKAKSEIIGDKLIITTRNETSPVWLPWNVSENFWFYEKLLEGWRPVMVSPTTVLWQIGSHYKFGKARKCYLNDESNAIVLPGADPGFYKVALEYKLDTSSRSLVLIKNNFSYALDANGFVSINPKQESVHFPVYVQSIDSIKLPINIMTNGTYTFQISSCQFSTISPPDSEVLVVPNLQYYQQCMAGGYCR